MYRNRSIQAGQAHVSPVSNVSAVRVRSGPTVRRGQFLGSSEKPFAFVWHDEASAVPEREIIVRAGSEGVCVWEGQSGIDIRTVCPGNKEVARLARSLDDWQRFFVKYYEIERPQRFFWGRFHEEGIGLARRLQAAFIDVAVVRYLRPTEDPQSHLYPAIEL